MRPTFILLWLPAVGACSPAEDPVVVHARSEDGGADSETRPDASEAEDGSQDADATPDFSPVESRPSQENVEKAIPLCVRLRDPNTDLLLKLSYRLSTVFVGEVLYDCKVAKITQPCAYKLVDTLTTYNLHLWGCECPPTRFGLVPAWVDAVGFADVQNLVTRYMALAKVGLDLSPSEEKDMRDNLLRLSEALLTDSAESTLSTCELDAGGPNPPGSECDPADADDGGNNGEDAAVCGDAAEIPALQPNQGAQR
jgi:hypothetical protein